MGERHPDEERPVDLGDELEPPAAPPTIDPEERIEEIDEEDQVGPDPAPPEEA